MESNEKTVERQIWACMETGNPQAAATLLDELQEVNETFALQIRAELAESYGTSL